MQQWLPKCLLKGTKTQLSEISVNSEDRVYVVVTVVNAEALKFVMGGDPSVLMTFRI